MPEKKKATSYGLVTAIACLILVTIPLCLVPPTSRDALTHHLAIPKLYLLHGGIYEIPDISFSYYPMNLDLLYMIPLSFGNDITPKLIHFSFALATAALIFNFLKKRINQNYGLLGALFFLSIPVIIKLSITVYVDLGLIFFSTASLILILNWAEHNRLKTLVQAGICCGLAVGTKYNGLIPFLLLSAIVPIIHIRSVPDRHNKSMPALKYGCIFVASTLIACSPWIVRNYIWTGNPLYPLHNNLFNPSTLPMPQGEKISFGLFKLRQLLYHETPLQILLLPIRIFFEGQDNMPQYFDGKLTPFLLFLPVMAFTPWKSSKQEQLEKSTLLLFSILVFLFALFSTSLRIRYFSPFIPPLVILSIFGLRNVFLTLSTRFNNRTLIDFLAVVLVTIMLLPSCTYLIQQYKSIKPFQYLSKKINRETYLEQHIPDYKTISYANSHLPEKAKLLCVHLGNRGYYIELPHLFDAPPQKSLFFRNLHTLPLEDMLRQLQKKHITHLLIRDELLLRTIRSSGNSSEQKRWEIFFRSYTQQLFTANGYSLYKLAFPEP